MPRDRFGVRGFMTGEDCVVVEPDFDRFMVVCMDGASAVEGKYE